MKKRLVLKHPPDSKALRIAMKQAHEHLDYIDWLTDTRRWLAGAQLSLADFAPQRRSRSPTTSGDRLERARAGARMVPRDEEPSELPPAADREDGGNSAADQLRRCERVIVGAFDPSRTCDGFRLRAAADPGQRAPGARLQAEDN
jgi:hypothetical protein